ncbi:hypothetical protein [Nocardiopsis protaetiae]|uniref:hypothetical protein n=1 Tax=Nocardiopsis protaetiae TaxID=3382270 RepID=UPI00387B3056
MAPGSSKALCGLCARPTGDQATVCTPCAQRATHALREVAEWLADDLTTATTRQTRLATTSSGGGRGTQTEPPLPFDLRASEALAVLRNTLSTWVRVLQDDGATTHPRTNTTAAMAAWLIPAIGWARHRDYGPDLIDETLAATTQARRATDRPEELTYAGRCPTCGAPIYALGARPTAQCRTADCDGAVGDVAAARLQLLRSAGTRLVTAEQAARALTTVGRPVTARWIRQLAAEKKLASIPGSTAARYWLGDILDLLLPSEGKASA